MTTKISTPRRIYSKSSSFYVGAKSELFDHNDALVAENAKQADLYNRQPARTQCKICNQKLSGVQDFTSHGIQYVFCSACGHLNGMHADTESFARDLYIEAWGANYARDYLDPNFVARADQIYAPKLEFLRSSLPAVTQIRLLDVGCGSGYLVYAALRNGIQCTGLDVNRTMVDFGNDQIAHLLNARPLAFYGESDFLESMVHTDANVVSAIGVIEHLREPAAFFDAFRRSKARYLFYSVPMFSFSVLVEAVFQRVFPRQLSGGHTHLFTEKSIAWMHVEQKLNALAEWRFGTDVMDLFRSMRVELEKCGASQKVLSLLDEEIGGDVDALQEVLDARHFCSEIHCVVEKA
jgi:SAM-dependent methyltransferase